MSQIQVSGSLAVTGVSDAIALRGKYNLSFSGTWTGTAILQRSFDDGAAWVDVYTTTSNIEQLGEEIEEQILHRVSFTRSTGSLTYRVSR